MQFFNICYYSKKGTSSYNKTFQLPRGGQSCRQTLVRHITNSTVKIVKLKWTRPQEHDAVSISVALSQLIVFGMLYLVSYSIKVLTIKGEVRGGNYVVFRVPSSDVTNMHASGFKNIQVVSYPFLVYQS